MSDLSQKARTDRIRELNDAFRHTFTGGRVLLTPGINALPPDARSAVLERIRTFDAFDGDNDPHHEHDFISFEIDGQTFFAKIDYYDLAMRYGSEDSTDPAQTTRVMTIMLAEEY